MKVLVTGAGGFLGQYVLRGLRQRGIPALAMGRTRPDMLAGADFMAVDLLAPAGLAELTRAAGASHLLHLAWVTEHGKYWTSPLNLRWVNATTRLVEAFCAAGGRHVVVAGTCAEYDWGHDRCHEDETPLLPATTYGVAKDTTRRLVAKLCARHQVGCAWARVFFPFGAGEARQRLIPSLVEALQGRAAPFGVNAPVYRDFLHARDTAHGLLALLQSGAAGSYNIASGQPTQLADLVQMLAQLLGRDARAVLDLPAERPAGPAMLVGDNAKLRGLGWQPEFSLEQGLEQSLLDLRARDRNQNRRASLYGT